MSTILGIDAGSVAISIVLIDENKQILKTAYSFHHGTIRNQLMSMLEKMNIESLQGIAVTTSSPDIVKNSCQYNTHVAIIRACQQLHTDIGSILFVGGENFGLIQFDEKGDYKSYKTNSSCAAGTGSFLDQQAKRLNLEDSESLSTIANTNTELPPRIATRCAVFAKTDLIHAQQQGYSLDQISDGLCEGLVKNIIDTLFFDKSKIRTPLVFSGGVSLNQAVIKHLKNSLHTELIVDDYSQLYGALGAALLHLEEQKPIDIDITDIASLIHETKKEKKYGYPPLKLHLSQFPDFKSREKYSFTSPKTPNEVEVDIYREFESELDVYLGIDIGSTSTKAVLIDKENNVLAGFYTKTAGQPIKATQAIFRSISDLSENKHISFHFSGVGTTGSGRKFIGKVISADLIVDEITAHARAAYELNHDVDTIIEIGGQDSKFTTMKNGMVTFSVMNNVCAAGTGSFIEEQAQKLGCLITEYADKAMHVQAPYASDRCTVFMERDLNYYLLDGYSVNEVLASVLHSVRENYLTKVSVGAVIGKKICFQGATAKNKALIAAFEQKLQKPIFVSEFCHLTGALGSALILAENGCTASKFRGIQLYKDDIPVEPEVCGLCRNNCKINKVTVQGEIVAFGFLCGRDFNTKEYIKNKEDTFNLVKEHKKIFKLSNTPKKYKTDKTIGIPEALFLTEEGVLWKHFFNTLGVKVISSSGIKEPIKEGKKITSAEFCAPVTAFIGHVKYLADKADYIFLPIYLETRDKENPKKYCYFTQYVSSLAASIESLHLEGRTIIQVIDRRDFVITADLVRVLKPIIKSSYWAVYFAYQEALSFYKDSKEKLKNIFKREFEQADTISIVFLGRPYTILDPGMNKHIPTLFENLKIKAFYQDMLSFEKEDIKEIHGLLRNFHWHYASKILESALVAAKTDGLYPVYITSFKCGPDSFAIEYFKRIMDKYNKPYLILQLDEHDSSVGYETRVEAAIRSFQNHHNALKEKIIKKSGLPINPVMNKNIAEKTLLIPCWDPINIKLIEAVLLRSGIDARMVPLTEQAIQLGPSTNTGMCIPVNIISQSLIDYIEMHDLEPENTSVWVFESDLACNIKMYPYFIKSAFESYGKNMEKVSIYLGDFTFKDFSPKITVEAFFAHYFGGMLRRMGCKIRPYEKKKGTTDKVIEQSLQIFYNTFLGNRNKKRSVKKVVHLFKKIKTTPGKKQQIAIFGDMYVRDNEIMNQDLIHFIETYGGEVVITPLSEMVKVMANIEIERSIWAGTYTDAISVKLLISFIATLEKNYSRYFNEILHETPINWDFDYKKVLRSYKVKIGQNGESSDNLLILSGLKSHYPEIRLFVQTMPAFCSAGIITEEMNSLIEKTTGIPIVTLNYDGTHKNQNEKLIPYMKFYK